MVAYATSCTPAAYSFDWANSAWEQSGGTLGSGVATSADAGAPTLTVTARSTFMGNTTQTTSTEQRYFRNMHLSNWDAVNGNSNVGGLGTWDSR